MPKNKIKEEVEEEVTESSESTEKTERTPRKKKKQNTSWLGNVRNFIASENTQKVFSLSMMLIAFVMFTSFISNIFSWQHDMGIAGSSSNFEFIFKNELEAENMLGKVGAVTGLELMNNGLGIAAFCIPLLIFLLGFKLLTSKSLLPFGKTFRWCFFLTVWLTTALGFILQGQSNLLLMAGNYGYQMSQTLKGVTGIVGTSALLLISGLAFVMVTFNLSFKPKAGEISDDGEVDLENELPLEVTHEDLVSENNHLKNIIKRDDAPRTIDFDNEPEEIFNENEIDDKEPEEELIDEEEEIETPATNEIPESDFETFVGEEDEMVVGDGEEMPHAVGDYDPKLDLSSYQYPMLDLLENYGDKKIEVNREELEANKTRIVETLNNYNIGIDKIKATIGPTVTLFEIIPVAGIRISKIKSLENDIALSLAALGIRIIAPIPGKGTIGIEVPNQKPEIVPMKNVLASDKFVNSDMELPIALGKTISNEVFVTDLTKMPHLLMAGATGQGKSVGLNAILVSLLYKKHPSQVKLVLVDPKKVELTLFKTIERHFLAKLPGEEEPIITDTKKVVNTLNSLCIEMDQRYDLLKDAQVRNIKEYNAKFIARKLNPNNGHKFLPYIVLVVDEFADLIMTAGKEVDVPIARLAQLARAVGIHLIIATQRPSVNIITGTIKANFPARIAFRVTSKIDSRTILDAGGADQLIGRGDMLYSTGADLIRLQCAFVDTPEVDRITEFIGSQRGYSDAFLLPEFVGEESSGGRDIELDDRDPLFDEAAAIIVATQQGSASLLQRKLKLGYNRAGRIIDQLEAARIIGPFEGSKAREVLVKDPMSLDQILQSLKNREN